MVPQCNPGYTVLIVPPSHWSPSLTLSTLYPLVAHLIGPPSHWFPNATLVIQFSLVPHFIGPPMWHWLHSSHWSTISLIPSVTPPTQLSLVPPSRWLPVSLIATLSTLFSLFPHLTGLPMQPFLFHSHYCMFIKTGQMVPMIDRPLLLNRSSAFCFVLFWPISQIPQHYRDVIMSAMAYHTTRVSVVYSTVLLRRKSKKTILTPKLRPNGGWSISGLQGSVLSTPQILDP